MSKPTVTAESFVPAFEAGNYGVLGFDKLTDKDVKEGDVIYMPTKSGSSYVMEVTRTEHDFIHGLVVRRGEEVDIQNTAVETEKVTIENIDGLEASIYTAYDYLKVGRQALIFTQNEEQGVPSFNTSKVVDGLMLISSL